ncbi:hypothetical protein CMUS01_09159 [Colletotrichum musicola]|uniref:Uncharacterized protein n=1 Tax=Colletotrichum musicola TaxID=2175873 RepID=A0A8H6K9L7_9PEZI|nr:hypothetical protein CMUS01_09159 [Colletotrichum musicola]
MATERKGSEASRLSVSGPSTAISPALHIVAEADCDTLKPAMTAGVTPVTASLPPYPPYHCEVCNPHHTRLRTFTKLIRGWWSVELASMALSFVTFGFYVGLLKYYDQKTIDDDDWFIGRPFSPFHSIQALTAQIGTVMRVCMGLPVAAAMGQLKWHHYRQGSGQVVFKLQEFDAASRGVAGSLKLLFSKHRLHSPNITLGGIFFIGTLYLSTAVQNTLSQARGHHRWQPTSSRFPNSSLPYSTYYNFSAWADMTATDREYLHADPGLKSAVLTGWANPNNLYRLVKGNSLPLSCSTDSCRWQNMTSLDINYACNTSQITRSPGGYVSSDQANITNRIEVKGASGIPTSTPVQLRIQTSDAIPDNSSFRGGLYDGPVMIAHIAAISDSGRIIGKSRQRSAQEAVECVLYWQIRTDFEMTYNDTQKRFIAGKVIENATAWVEPSQGPGRPGNITFEGPCNRGSNSTIYSGDGDCLYKVSIDAHNGFQRYLREFVKGSVRPAASTTDGADSGFLPDTWAVDMLWWSWMRNLDAQDPSPLRSAVGDYVYRLAQRTTDAIRAPSADWMQGDVWTDEYYEIRWRYVLFLCAMLVASVYLFFFAMWRTREMPAWKTSLLPFLYHGFGAPAREQGDDFSNLAWMEKASGRKKVVLRDDGDGLGLKLRDFKV